MISQILTGHFWQAASVPAAHAHHRLDWVLASALVTGAAVFTKGTFWPDTAVTWVALAGGVVGVMIALVRLYRLCRGKGE